MRGWFWITVGLLTSADVRRRWREMMRGERRRDGRLVLEVGPTFRAVFRRVSDDELRAQIARGERNPDWMRHRTLEGLYSPRKCPCSRCVEGRRSGVHPLQLI